MVKIVNKWKPVELDSSVFVGGIDGLIGIEECTDYDLNDFTSNKKACLQKPEKVNKVDGIVKKKKKKKREVPKRNNDNIKTKSEIFSPSKSGATSQINTEVNTTEIEENLMHIDAWSSYGLPTSILQSLREQKFTQPTPIQSLTLPAAILGRRDILGAAETGSGKTLAFGIPILTGILNIKEKQLMEVGGISASCHSAESLPSSSDSEEEQLEELLDSDVGCVRSINNVQVKTQNKPLYALILTPTRELAIQIKNNLDVFTKYTGVNVAVIMGGMAAVKQERILSKGPEIVIATPGRLWELIQLGNNHLSQVDNIRFLAIDETDRMLEKGHFQELHDLLERINLNDEKRKQRQNFVFSATLSLVHELPKHIVRKRKLKSKKFTDMTPAQKLQKIVDMLGITEPKIVDITQGTGTSSTLTECRITCDIEEKDFYVYYFLQKHAGRTLIFCNSIGCVKRLTTLLGILNCNPLPLHASMQQRQRLRNLERFRDNANSILVATDVAARGLDIPCIEHVLHYQTPRTSESYVHRSGRTARASRQGITVLLMEPNELRYYLKLCKTLGKGKDIPIFPVQESLLNAVKERVKLARDLDRFQLRVRKCNSEVGWFQKAAQDMDIIVDDRASKAELKDVNNIKRMAEMKRKQLQSLLNKPIFTKGIAGELSLSFMQQVDETAIDAVKRAKLKSKPQHFI